MSDRKPWRPRVSSTPEFNPFGNATAQRGMFDDRLSFDDAEESNEPHQTSQEVLDEEVHDTADERKH